MSRTFALVAFHGIKRTIGNPATMIAWGDERYCLHGDAEIISKSFDGHHTMEHALGIFAEGSHATTPIYSLRSDRTGNWRDGTGRCRCAGMIRVQCRWHFLLK